MVNTDNKENKMDYQIILKEKERVDADNIIVYDASLTRESSTVLTLTAVHHISSNTFHFSFEGKYKLEEIGIDPHELEEKLENRNSSIKAIVLTPDMSKADLIAQISKRTPLIEYATNKDEVAEKVLKLVGAGAKLSDLYFFPTDADLADVEIADVAKVESRIVEQFSTNLDKLVDAIKRHDIEEAKRLTSIKEKLVKDLEVIGSDMAKRFYPTERRGG